VGGDEIGNAIVLIDARARMGQVLVSLFGESLVGPGKRACCPRKNEKGAGA
jgi:hypothetical protein